MPAVPLCALLWVNPGSTPVRAPGRTGQYGPHPQDVLTIVPLYGQSSPRRSGCGQAIRTACKRIDRADLGIQGFPQIEAENRYGIIVAKLHATLVEVLKAPEV